MVSTEAFVDVPGGTLHVHVLESGRLAAETLPAWPREPGDRDEPAVRRAAAPLVIGAQRYRLRVCVDPAGHCPPEHVVARTHGWEVNGFGILVRRSEKAELVPAPEAVGEHVRRELFPVLARWLASHGHALLWADQEQAIRRRLGRLEAEAAGLRAELAELAAERGRHTAS